jgi:hypothetical protein
MRPRVSAERLAEIAGVKATTVRRLADELLELLEQDLESQGVTVRGVDSS